MSENPRLISYLWGNHIKVHLHIQHQAIPLLYFGNLVNIAKDILRMISSRHKSIGTEYKERHASQPIYHVVFPMFPLAA